MLGRQLGRERDALIIDGVLELIDIMAYLDCSQPASGWAVRDPKLMQGIVDSLVAKQLYVSVLLTFKSI